MTPTPSESGKNEAATEGSYVAFCMRARASPLAALHFFRLAAEATNPCHPIVRKRSERIRFEHENVLGHDAIRLLPGRGFAVELLIGEPNQCADKSGALHQPFGD